jgi:hypothetical protein
MEWWLQRQPSLSRRSNDTEILNTYQCRLETLLHMPPNPLEILKRGYSEFLRKIKDRKDKLNVKLSRGEAISTSDEQWLDNEGNTINEERILETLELAPDYNRAVAELDSNGQEIVRKLRDWAGCGASAKVAGNKRKHAYPLQTLG